VSERASRDHYSYTLYNDPNTARTFDDRRFGGPIGDLIATSQATVLAGFIGVIHNRTILDVGTGTGRAALLMARAGARVTGVDASEEMLAIARQRAAAEGAAIQFRTGDAHALDFADRSFDVVISLRVIMHTPRWADCVAELCRVADQLVILDYPSSRSTALVQSRVRRILAAIGRPTEPYRVFSLRQIDDALKRSGFQIRSIHRQFVLPIALHKMVGSKRFTVATEGWLERLGVLRVLGSPVTVVAERCAR
jgi:2-polyprenyl-3-methyl-5-hydroxy-6-metoxy-1,4-benzoquinol methylase